MHAKKKMLGLLALLTLYANSVDANLSRFIRWSTQESHECGLPSIPVTIVPNLVFCNHGASAVFSLHTFFEGSPHSFGITACDDNHIFIGLRVDHVVTNGIDNHILVYMEFDNFEEFLSFFDSCVIFHTFLINTTNKNLTKCPLLTLPFLINLIPDWMLCFFPVNLMI